MNESLITVQEADEIVSVQGGATQQLRVPMMLVLGVLLVIIATLLVLLVISLFDYETGWQSVLPFLESKPLESLQIN